MNEVAVETEMKTLVMGLADHLFQTISPRLGMLERRRVSGRSAAGDAQFLIDDEAEAAVHAFVRDSGCPVALMTENGALTCFGEPCRYVLIVDPIDGTRPAAAGLETCCISIAAAPFTSAPSIGDVSFAILKELKSGAFIYGDEEALEFGGYPESIPNLSSADDLNEMFWSIEFNGHPADLMTSAYGHLIDRSANRGGVFVFNSAAYSISRIIAGQLDAYVDIGNRLLKDHPDLLPRFLEAGGGHVLHLFPYDIAAAVFLASRAGLVITDAFGRPLTDTLLLDTSADNQQSCIAASTQALHDKLMDAIDWSLGRRP